MSRYDGFRALATRLITKNGRLVTIQRPGEATPVDATKPWEVTADDKPVPQEGTVRGVIVPIMHKRIDGTAVLATDKTCFISAQDIENSFDMPLQPLDLVVDSVNSRTFVVQDVEDISPGEQYVLFILQLRGND